MELIRNFGKLNKHDAAIAGGKGASLGEMTQAGIPVPPGFVILSESFEKFLEETDLNVEIDTILHSVNHKEIHTVENASEKIQALILGARMPEDIAKEIQSCFKKLDTKYVAVRSSATAEDSASAAWAGQLDSFLNTTQKDLLEKVKRCWASLFTPRAIFYRFEKELHKHKISVAVVVQKMVESEVSGIAFSVHPVTQDYNQLIIEAGLGLGEAIVSGQITPDSYVVEKQPRTIIDKNVSVQNRGLFRSEKGGNEWRDILEKDGEKQTLTDEQILELSEIIIGIEKHYGFPCDIEWAFEKGKFYIVQSRPITTLSGQGTVQQKSTEKPLELYKQEGKLGLYQVMLPYLTATYGMQKYFKNSYDHAWMYYQKGNFTALLKKKEMAAIAQEVLGNNIGLKSESFQALWKQWQRIEKDLFVISEKIHNLSLAQLSGEELWQWHQEIFKSDQEMWSISIFIDALDVGADQVEIEKITQQHRFLPEEVYVLLTPSQQSYITEAEYDIEQVKKGVMTHDDFTAKYFWYGTDYFSYREVDDYFIEEKTSKKTHLTPFENPSDKQKKILEKYQLKENPFEVFKILAQWRDDRKKINYVGLYGLCRLLAEGLRRQQVDQKHINNLIVGEEKDVFLGKIDERKLQDRFDYGILLEIITDGSWSFMEGPKGAEQFKHLTQFLPGTNVREVRGNIASSGVVRGIARIVPHYASESGRSMQEGDILITSMTRPEFVPLMKKAGAIVTDEGGISSHAAIVSRELKKPCIIGTKIATQVFKDGDMVEVDADNGVVSILEAGVAEKTTKKSDLVSDFITFDNKEWFLTITRNMSLWHQYLSNIGAYYNIKDFGIDAKMESLTLTENSTRTYCFCVNPNFTDCGNKILEAISSKPRVKKLKDLYEKNADNLFKALEACDKNLTVKNWERFVNRYQIMTAGLWITAIIGRKGFELLSKKLLGAGISEKELPFTIATITYPKEHTPLFDSQVGLLEIGAGVQAGKLSASIVEKKLKIWVEKFGSIPVNFCEDPWTYQDAKKQLDDFLAKDCKQQLILTVKNHEERISQAKKRLKDFDKDIVILAEAIAEATYLNEFRKNVFCRVSLGYRDIFGKIAKMGGSNNWRDCFYLLPEEMTNLLKGEKIKISTIVEKRKLFGMIETAQGRIEHLDLKAVNSIAEYIHRLQGKSSNQTAKAENNILKGFSANKGKVQGIVKVILSSKDFSKLLPGEILVTSMTSVDFVPVMERAAAFVTNEGGITSHASIVAREMNKPCIIATKVATQVLKDGDLVEVDADNGVVRILEAGTGENTSKNALAESLKKIDWDVQRFNAYPFFLSSAATLSGFKLPWNLKYKHFLAISHNKNIEWHYDKEDYARIGNIFWQKVKNLKDLIGLINEYRETYQKSAKNAAYKENDVASYSVKELQSLLKKQVERICDSAGTAHIIECVTFAAEQKLLNEYNIDPSTIKAAEKSFLKQAELYAHELCGSGKSDKDILKQFKEKFAWMQSSYLGRNEVSIATIRELAHKAETEHEVHKKSVSGKGKDFVEMVSHIFSWQDERKANILATIYASQPVLEALARKVGISNEAIKFLLPEEIDAITDKEFQKLLVQRSKLFVDYAPSDLRRTSLVGEDAQQFIDAFSNVVTSNDGTIKGQVAFAGKVKGVVRVCLSLESIESFKAGEILVASMTRPEYVPAMKKAIAFVTDEGGITCHAAIVAREMKKPCVIGTKIATKVLKDGDIVEVDANKGIVKILGK